MNTRRELLIAFGVSAVAVPLGSFAQQQGKVWRIGFLGLASASGWESRVEALRAGLRDLGYVEGKNLVIEFRWAEGEYDRLPKLAVELVQSRVDIIVTHGTPGPRAARQATTTIPIVMASSIDPVGAGFVASLARPGGNITGLANLSSDISPKLLEMLRAMAPKVTRVAVLTNPGNTLHLEILKSIQAAAQKLGVKILPVEAKSPQQVEHAFSIMARERAGAVIVAADALFTVQRRQIAELAAKNRLPSIAIQREYVEAGCLMSYGQNFDDHYRRAATYVDKIFKGTKPSDLPVEQSTRLELFINRKTAKALGLTIPPSLLVSAEKVIE